MNDDIVGIDLGTTNSLIGVMEAGFPILLADANGARLDSLGRPFSGNRRAARWHAGRSDARHPAAEPRFILRNA